MGTYHIWDLLHLAINLDVRLWCDRDREREDHITSVGGLFGLNVFLALFGNSYILALYGNWFGGVVHN